MKNGTIGTPKMMESHTKRKRLEAQGFCGLSDQRLKDLTFGIRFTYALCSSLAAVGVVLANIPLLLFLMVVAYLGVILPNHPFDYLYNYLIRHWLHKPKLPPSTNQKRFACGIATPWLAFTIYLFYSGQMLGGYLLGGTLVLVSSIVSATDFCIPSFFYNLIYRPKETG